MSDILGTALASGGGFVAGVTATLIYARAHGYAIRPPWHRAPWRDQNHHRPFS